MSSQHEEQAAERPDLAAAHSAWAPFASYAFCWLWLANTVSALGTWIQNTASAWIMTDLAPSPIMVSLVQAAAQLPVLLLALPAGALADLTDLRRNLILSNMWMLVAAIALAVVAALGRLDATSLLALTALLQSAPR
jgi:MFS family permease